MCYYFTSPPWAQQNCPFLGWYFYYFIFYWITELKHATQFVQWHVWLGDIIPMSPVTTQLWETSAKGTSQKLCLWRTFSCGTLCGDIKWRVAIASQLVTREDQPQRVRAVQNKGPIPLKGFCETPALASSGCRAVQKPIKTRDPSPFSTVLCLFIRLGGGTEHLVLRTTDTSDSWASGLANKKYRGTCELKNSEECPLPSRYDSIIIRI